MHYAFDEWMRRTFPQVPFERYADDVVVHCASLEQAKLVLGAVRKRLTDCKLELHPEKTQIVHCKDDRRREDYSAQKLDFLGYTLRPRTSRSAGRKPFVGFLPAISDKAAKKIRATVRNWHLSTWGATRTLESVAELLGSARMGGLLRPVLPIEVPGYSGPLSHGDSGEVGDEEIQAISGKVGLRVSLAGTHRGQRQSSLLSLEFGTKTNGWTVRAV